MGLPGSEDSLTIACSTQYQTYGRTDVQLIPSFAIRLTHVNKNLAIANRSRVSCINTNRSHNLATSGESHRYVVAFNRVAGGGIWLRQESLRHILTSLGTALRWEEDSMLVKRIAACTHLSSTVSQ